MKTLRTIVVFFLIFTMLTMPVLAAEFVPSRESADSPRLLSYILDEEDGACCYILIIPDEYMNRDDILDEDALDLEYEASEEMEETIRISLKTADAELKEKTLPELVPGFEAIWEQATGGAPVGNAFVYDLFEIVRVCTAVDAFITDEPVTVKFTVDGLTADDKFMIIHKPTGSEAWRNEDYTIDENGVITMSVDKLSPFAIIKDNGEAPVATETSPQTGVYESVAAGIAAIAAAGLGIAAFKKSRRISAR